MGGRFDVAKFARPGAIRSPGPTDRSSSLNVSLDDPNFNDALLKHKSCIDQIWSHDQERVPVLTVLLYNAEVRGPGDARFRYSYGLVSMQDMDRTTFRRVGLLEYESVEKPKQTAVEQWFADVESQDLTLL